MLPGVVEALDRLVSLIYTDLQRLARRQLRGQPSGRTLNTTSLVHEAYLKLVNQSKASFQDRAHFFRVAARAMRQIVVDYARHRSAQKRGGDQPVIPLDQLQIGVREQAEVMVQVDEALGRLADLDGRLVQMVECRFFAGLTREETAEAFGISTRTVERDWKRARAWLRLEMNRGAPPEGAAGDRE